MRGRVQHWSALKKSPLPACDISAVDSFKGNKLGKSNVSGTALFLESNENGGDYSEFGAFTDRRGNKIFVLDPNKKKSKEIISRGFLGGGEGVNPWDSAYNSIQISPSEQPHRRAEYLNQGIAIYGLNLPDLRGFDSSNWLYNRYGAVKKSYFDLLEIIENQPQPLTRPIVIYHGRKNTPRSITDLLTVGLAVAEALTSNLGLPIPKKIFQVLNQALEISKGGYKSPEQMIKSLTAIGEVLAPTWTKGAVAKYSELEEKANSYPFKYGDKLQKGKEAIENYVTGYGSSPVSRARKLIEQTGLPFKEVDKFFNRYQGKFEAIDLRKAKDLNEANKILRNASNMLTAESLALQSKSGTIINDIINRPRGIGTIPALADTFMSGQASMILRSMPNIEELSKTIIENVDQVKNTRAYKSAVDVHSALIGANFGVIAGQEAFDDLTLASLQERAQEYARQNIPFIIPDSIRPEKRDEYKKELSQSTSAQVEATSERWNFDNSLGKFALVGSIIIGGYYAVNKGYFK